MDAKPFRPLRPLSVASDDNIAPARQFLHQKNKSMASLRTQPSLGALHARRGSALGDKSNTTKANMSHIDGKVADGKAMVMIKARDQIVNAQENVVPALGAHKDAFSRPAQRPSLKGASVLAPAPGKNNKQHAYTKSTASDDPRLPTQAIGKYSKLAATVIYKDIAEQDDSDVDSGAIGTTRIEPSGSHVRQPSTASTVHAAAPPSRKPRHYQSHPVLKSTTTSLQQAASLLDLDLINDSLSQDVLPIETLIAEDDADTPYLDAVEELSPINSFPEFARSDSGSLPEAVAGSETQSVVDSIGHQEEVAQVAGKDSPELPDRLSDRDDEDYYDDQGYTTAHSYRFTGDRVHGGGAELVEPEPSLTVTVMEAPKFTKQAIREIEEARKIVENTRSPEDIEEEAWDISMVAEYGDEIFEYMREMEMHLLPNAHYMDIQTEIQWSMRAILMDWVIQVHGRFNLLPETLYLAVNYIDRFLAVKVVSLGKLQLVGATAVFLAAKYEEINCPSVQEMVFMVDGGYSVDEILKAERYMLSMLNFELGWPGPMSFLRRISKADDYDLETRTLAKYFLEVTVMDERFVACPPSFLASAAHCLSRMILDKGHWTPEHVHYSGYTFAQIESLTHLILECCHIAEKHHFAVLEKYSDKRFKKCALYVKNQLQAGFVLDPSPSPTASMLVPRLEGIQSNWDFTTSTTIERMPIPMHG